MANNFIGQRVIVRTGRLEDVEYECGTIVGEMPTLFAISTETGSVKIVWKSKAYLYDVQNLKRIEDMCGKFTAVKGKALDLLAAAWDSLEPLMGKQELEMICKERPRPPLVQGTECHVLEDAKGRVLLKGSGTNQGIAFGAAQIVRSHFDLLHVRPGDVLIAEDALTTWPWFKAAMIASAIVVERGAMNHSSMILADEFGIPCVRFAENATQMLADGQIVIVDGYTGNIHEVNTFTV